MTPTLAEQNYRFSFGDVVLEIDPRVGGRVGKLALAGTDLVQTSRTDPTTWGSVFWTSPRSDWTPELWPPPAAIDNAAYTGSIDGTRVVVEGPEDTGLGVHMSKEYSADARSGWITITYTIHASRALRAAPWEVTRVPRAGLIFFPRGDSVTPGPLDVTEQAGIVWFDDGPMTAMSPEGDKLAADGAEGWTAYVTGTNLFLKKYEDQPASAQAPGEGEVDIYPGAGFLEYEIQGPYRPIAASSSATWTVKWRVVPIPSSVTIGAGSTSLVDFARQELSAP